MLRNEVEADTSLEWAKMRDLRADALHPDY